MTRLSFDVPAVISRWKQGNAHRLRRVLWIFATCVPGAAWKRSAALRTKRTELVYRQPEQVVDASCVLANSRAKGSLIFYPIIRDDLPYRLRASALALACVVSRSKSKLETSWLAGPKAPPILCACSASLSQRKPRHRQ